MDINAFYYVIKTGVTSIHLDLAPLFRKKELRFKGTLRDRGQKIVM